MTFTKETLGSLEHWRRLNPHLTISAEPAYQSSLIFSTEMIQQQSERLHHDGYIQCAPVFHHVELSKLRCGIENLVKVGLPPAFIYIYDEVWVLFERLKPLLSYFLGEDFGLLPHFWAWHIAPDQDGKTSGWPAHVDYPGDCAFFDDFLISLSLWIPLSDAGPENGCMNLLPLSRQKTYDKPIKEPSDIALEDVRCLPAKAGSVLGWRQDIWHWSGRSSKFAETPRISLSLEFQNRAYDPLCPPLYDLHAPPTPQQRIALIFGQFSKYDHMEKVPPELEKMAAQFGAL